MRSDDKNFGFKENHKWWSIELRYEITYWKNEENYTLPFQEKCNRFKIIWLHWISIEFSRKLITAIVKFLLSSINCYVFHFYNDLKLNIQNLLSYQTEEIYFID
jgi:hypothetical protein